MQTNALDGIKDVLDNISSSIVDILSYVSVREENNIADLDAKLDEIAKTVGDSNLNYVESVREIVDTIRNQVNENLKILSSDSDSRLNAINNSISSSTYELKQDIQKSYEKLQDVQSNFDEIKNVLHVNSLTMNNSFENAISVTDALRSDFESKITTLKESLLEKVTEFKNEFTCDSADKISELKFNSENLHTKSVQNSLNLKNELKSEIDQTIDKLSVSITELKDHVTSSTLKMEGANKDVVTYIKNDFITSVNGSVDKMAFSHDGRHLAVFSSKNELSVFNSRDGLQLVNPRLFSKNVIALDFTRDDNRLQVRFEDSEKKEYELRVNTLNFSTLKSSLYAAVINDSLLLNKDYVCNFCGNAIDGLFLEVRNLNDENDVNTNSSKSLKLKENNAIKETAKIKTEKNKNKEFFLFPINNKKNKDKNKNKENKELCFNDKSLSEKNNIKINYLEKKNEITLKKEENKIINNISDQYLSKDFKENEKIKISDKSTLKIDRLSETSIRFEMLNSHVNPKKEENKIHTNQYAMNSPESTTSFSFEASTKEKSSIQNENLNIINNQNNINENKSPINMTINIINNQYIYQQYPFFNFNFNNFALMQSQFLYYYHVPSDLFFEKLSKEIKEYENLTTKNIEILDKIRKKYFIKVEKMIETGLNKKYEIKFGHYGSYFTNLSIEGSDVDIRVYYKPKKQNLDFLKDIIDLLNIHLSDFENINPILSASVPVIVLQINISKEINSTILKFLPYFEKKDISHINIDLTFTSDEKEFKRPGEIVNYINNNVKNYEDIRPLLLVIKRYFRIMKMNKSFTGGLSSYSIFLLILAFLKNNGEKMNSGKLLYYIMEKY